MQKIIKIIIEKSHRMKFEMFALLKLLFCHG